MSGLELAGCSQLYHEFQSFAFVSFYSSRVCLGSDYHLTYTSLLLSGISVSQVRKQSNSWIKSPFFTRFQLPCSVKLRAKAGLGTDLPTVYLEGKKKRQWSNHFNTIVTLFAHRHFMDLSHIFIKKIKKH